MENKLPDWLIICIWRALLGEIYPAIRAIAIEFKKNRTLIIRYYLDREIDDMDRDSVEVVATNISASLGSDEVTRIEVECEYSTLGIGQLDCLGGFIFCRREYD
jgi:hypothetical protein